MSLKNEQLTIYEQGTLTEITGDTLRPGGLEITKESVLFCQFPQGANVLDVGCGMGTTVKFLIEECGLNAVGIDSSKRLIEQGKKEFPGLPLFEGNGENLHIGSEEMDGVFMECSLSVMKDEDYALSEAYRLLKNNGWLIISDVYFRNMPETLTLPDNSCLIGARTKESLIAMIREHGLELELWQDKSEWIKKMVVESIMKFGTTEKLWNCLLPGIKNQCSMKEKIKELKPGYFLLIARKRLPVSEDREHNHEEDEECCHP